MTAPHTAGGRPPDPPAGDRADLVKRAYAEVGVMLLDWEAKHGLTSAEFASCLLRLAQERLHYVIQAERRRDGSAPPGMAGPPPRPE